MPATLTRDDVYSLWSRGEGQWHHMATSSDEAELQLKAKSLQKLFTNKRFVVIQGASAPRP